MQTISVKRVENGFHIKIEQSNVTQEYVWRSLDVIPMVAWLGRHLNEGRKLYVTDDPNQK